MIGGSRYSPEDTSETGGHMRYETSVTIVLVVMAAFLCWACEDKSADEGAEGGEASKAAGSEAGGESEAEGGESPAERADREAEEMKGAAEKKLGIERESGEPTEAMWESRKALCEATFAKDDIAEILGRDDLEGGLKGMTRPKFMGPGKEPKEVINRPVTGVTECEWIGGGGGSTPPEVTLSVMFDCRSGSLDVEKHRGVARQTVDEGNYEDIDLGKGGHHSKREIARQTSHQVVFVSDRAPCAVILTETFSDEDHTMAVAEHIYEALTEDNAVTAP